MTDFPRKGQAPSQRNFRAPASLRSNDDSRAVQPPRLLMVHRSDAVVKPIRPSGRHEGFGRGAYLGISQICPWAKPQPAR